MAIRAIRRLFPRNLGGFISTAALLLTCGLSSSGQAPTLAPSWSQQLPATIPTARYANGLAYDAAHSQVVMFGGFTNGGVVNDTWLWNGTNWTQANPGNSPSARSNLTMVYDAAQGQVVMFGGAVTAQGSSRLNDTWLWNGTNWTQVTGLSTTPPARSSAAMAYDAAHGQVVLFGGLGASNAQLGDTWVWNGTSWSLASSNGPLARFGASMAYDGALGEVILFGGSDSGGNENNDTWAWNGTGWTQLSPANSPTPARDSQSMEYDAAQGQVVMFGGENALGGVYYGDTWVLSGTSPSNLTWTQQTSVPASRSNSSMTYDAALGQVVMFGGYSNTSVTSTYSDTWTWGPTQDFGGINVCPGGLTSPEPCNITLSLTYNFSTATTLGTPQVVTQGSPNLDFTQASGNCSGSISANSSCTMNITFAPSAPGLRTGAVNLVDNSGNLLVSSRIYGVGQAPLAVFSPLVTLVENLGSLTGPKGVAIDAVGDLFVSDYEGHKVVELGPSTGNHLVIVAQSPQVVDPQGLAIDGAGNLYVADTGISGVVKIPWGCIVTSSSTCQQTVTNPLGLSGQFGVSVDAQGDVFISAYNQGVVVEVPVNGGTQTPVYSGTTPIGTAVDAAGDLFVADSGAREIVKVPAGCTSSSCYQTIGSNWSSPESVSLDAAGDLYVTDGAPNQDVVEFPADCITNTCSIPIANTSFLSLGSGFAPYDAVTDSHGNIYIADWGIQRVDAILQGFEAFDFSQSNENSISGDSPRSVLFQNIGNDTLTAAGQGLVFTDPDFTQVPGTAPQPDCTSTFSLAPGSLCNLSVQFDPLSVGPLSGFANFYDNALNNPSALQSFPLDGTGLGGPVALSVTGGGTGTGSVVSTSPTGINCNWNAGTSGTCSTNFTSGLTITLQETPTNGSTFNGWGGACSSAGTNQFCYVTLLAAASASATFSVAGANTTLTVTDLGSGGGEVTDQFSGITCTTSNGSNTGPCSASYLTGTPVTLTATPSGGASFLGWGGACASNGTSPTCALTINSSMNATATFGQQSFGSVNLCPQGGIGQPPCSGTQAVSFTAASTVTNASVQVFTQGAPGGDFSVGNGCTGTILAGNSCNVNVTFNPQAPGLRMGAVQISGIVNSVSGVVATIPISGIGVAPEMAFGPGTTTAEPTSGLHYNVGVALDGAGNLYIADYVAGKVVKLTPGGVQTTVLSSYTSAPGQTPAPIGVAVDGAGNLFIADLSLPYAVKLSPGGVQTTVGSGLMRPIGVAVDGTGDAFIADQNGDRVVEVTPNGVQTTVPATGLQQPNGVAVDSAGDVFISDSTLNEVVEVTPAGVQTTVPATGLSDPYGLAVDAAGDVFIADGFNSRVLEVTPAGVQTTVGSGLGFPSGVALDAAGDVFVGDQGQGEVFEVNRSQSPSLHFGATTPVGTISSPQSITIQDIGNQSLSISTLSVGPPFNQVILGNDTPSDCNNGGNFTLTQGQDCTLNISFEPVSVGSFSTNAVITDDSLNTDFSPFLQIPLTGTSVAAPTYTLTVTSLGTGSGAVTDSAEALNCTINNGTASGTCSLGYTGGSVVTLMATANASTFVGWGGACASFGTASTCTLTISGTTSVSVNFAPLGGGSNTLTVTEPGNGSGTVTDNQTLIACTELNGSVSGSCSASYSSSTVTLTAAPSGNSTFAGWGGACASSGSNSTCVVTMTSAESVTATFIAPGATQPGSLQPITAGIVYGQGGSLTSNTESNGGISANSLADPAGAVLDSNGNLYVGDTGTNRVLFYPRGSTTATRVYGQGGSFTTAGNNQGGLSANSLNNPYTVALDSSGNLYVADLLNNRVLFYPAGSTTATRVYGQNGSFTTNIANNGGISANSLSVPYGVAVDSSGNLYVSDTGNNRVLFYPAGSTTATRVYGQGGSFTTNNAAATANSLNGPHGLTVDSSGDLYVADELNNRVLFYPANSTTATRVYGQNGSFTSGIANNGGISANSLNQPFGVTLDGGGNVYVGDTFNNRVLFYPFGSTTATRVYGQSGSFTSNSANSGGVSADTLNDPEAISLDGSGNFYVPDYGNNRVLEYGPFGNVNVCPTGQSTPAPCNTTITLSYYAPEQTNFGATEVVTQGAVGLDFSLANGGTCTGTVHALNICTVNATFAPLAPGLRTGAVTLYDNNGNLIASAPVYGVGQGPLAAFGTPAPVALNTGSFTFSHPNGVMLDAAGDLFIGDTENKRVVEFAANGTQTTVGFGLQFPQGMAMDGAGDLFIADNNLNEVVEIPAGCITALCQKTVGTGYQSQLEVAVDAVGDVFFSDYNDEVVVKVAPSGAQTVVYSAGPGSEPVGVAADAAGDLFIADLALRKVVEIPAGCANSSCQISLGGGWSTPQTVAVDAAGDVYVADNGYGTGGSVLEVPAGCTQSNCVVTVASGTQSLTATVDSLGDVFYGNNATGQIFEVTRSLPPSLNFALTAIGATSTDSPQAASVQNIGNQSLSVTVGATSTTSFGENSTASPCGTTVPSVLVPGASCSESFSFTPQTTGILTDSASFSDNTLNLSSSVVLQTVNLSGTSSVNGSASGAIVPNVVGMTESAAATALTAAGLTVGSVGSAYSSSEPQGSVSGEAPAAGAQVSLGSAVNLLISTGEAPPPAASPLTFENNYFVTGDYAVGGVSFNGVAAQNGMVTGTISISDLTTCGCGQGVPDGADVVDAFLYWTTVENTPAPSGNSATFLGYSISGQQVGSDVPSYSDGTNSGTLRVYRADINTYFQVQPSWNGERLASGNFAVSLPDVNVGGGQVTVTEGANMVVIYRALVAPNSVSPAPLPLKAVVIYDGSALPASSTTQIVQGFYDAKGPFGNVTTFSTSGPSWTISNSGPPISSGMSQYSAPLNAGAAYSAVILSVPVANSDNDGILDSWKAGPAAGDFFVGQPGYYDVKTQSWVSLAGAKSGKKDLFVQLDWMCGAVMPNGQCDPSQENLFPSPDASGNDPLAIVQQAFTNSGVALHLKIGNAVPETTCTDSPGQLCEFPGEPGVIGWKNSLEFSKIWPRNFNSCATGGDCTARFPYGQKDSYHYVLFGHSLAIPAWNTRFGSLTAISVVSNVTTITTTDRGVGIYQCPSRITISGVLSNPNLNGVYNTSSCPDTKTIVVSTPGVPNWTYNFATNTPPEPAIGLTPGTVSSISGYSDLGGADSAVTLALWETDPLEDMSKKATVIAGTLFHELGHTIGLTHGGLYYKGGTGSYVPTFDINCKPNYQSSMNYLFQLDGVGMNGAVAYSNQTLQTLSESTLNTVTNLVDINSVGASYSTSAWYSPTLPTGSSESQATLHCDGSPVGTDTGYFVEGSVNPVTPAWMAGQDITFDGVQPGSTGLTGLPGYNDITNIDLRQIGATGGEFASLASVLSFQNATSPLTITPGGSVAVGPGGTVAVGNNGTITLAGTGSATVSSGAMISSGGIITLGTGGSVKLSTDATGSNKITPGTNGVIALSSGDSVTLSAKGTFTIPSSGGTITLGGGGNVTLGAGGTITLPGPLGTQIVIPAGGSYDVPAGGTVTLGGGGTVTLGGGGNVTLGGGGNITLGGGGNVTLGGGGNVTLGAGGTVTLGGGGNITLGGGGNITLGGGGTITLGGGGTVTLGGGGNVTLGGGGNVTLGGGGNITLGAGGNVTLGGGGTVTLGAGGNVTLGGGGTTTGISLSSGGTFTLGAGGNITLGGGGNVTLGAGGSGTITVPGVTGSTMCSGSCFIQAGGTITLGGGGTVTMGAGGNITLGGGGTITLGGGGTVTLGGGGNVTLGGGGNVTLGGGGNITLGGGGNVTLGGGGNVTLGGGGANATELDYNTANSVVHPPTSPTYTVTPASGNSPQTVLVSWQPPAFGVVQSYTVSRSVNGGTPVPLSTISGNPPATTYTDTNPPAGMLTYTITTTLVPDTSGGNSRQSSPSFPATLTLNQTITLSALQSSYMVSNSPVTVSATATSGLTVTFSASGSCSVGSSSPGNGGFSASVNLTGTGSCTVTATAPAGTNSNNNYNAATPVSATFAIVLENSGTTPQVINFPQLPSIQYGTNFTPNASDNSGIAITYTTMGPCNSNGTTTGIGTCTITANAPSGPGPNSTTYNPATATQSFKIYPAVLTVTAGNLPTPYGQIPSLTTDYAITGFVNGDSPSVVTGSPALSTTATTTSAPAIYPINVSAGSLSAANYTFAFVPGALTVQQASATISISNIPANAVYGGSFTPTYLYSGTGTPTESTTSSTTSICTVGANGLVSFVGVGTCTLTAHATATADSLAATGSPQSFSVAGAAATISISNIPANAVYGGSFTPTYLYSGTGTPTESTTSSTTSICTVGANGLVSFVGVGTCTLTAHATATADSLAATGSPQSFSVAGAAATISISNIPANAVYGGSFTPTYLYSGTGTPTESTTSSTTSICTVGANGLVNFVGVGTCTLTAHATATADSLAATGSPQGFSVGKATQTITFSQPSSPVTYGVSPISLTATSTSTLGVTFSIDSHSTASASLSGNMLTIKGVGTVVIEANQAGNTDYLAAAQVQRSIVVSPALLTVTANNATRAYGAANPTFTAKITGFVNSDPSTVVSGSPSFSTTATTTSLPGSYPITVAQGTLAAANYTFTFVNGTLTVTSTGSVPASGTTCNGAYTGTFKGNLTVSKGQTCIFVSGGTTGSITGTGGNIILQSATVGSSLTINSGGMFTIGPSTTINGNFTVESLPASTTANQLCGSTITGSVIYQSDAAPVLIGSGTPSCAGNVIKGSLQVASNSAAVTMEGNKVTGSIQVQSNPGATTIDGNTVGVSLQDQSNTGATQVFNNIITNALQCQSNSSITGGGNTAASKSGQCAKF